MRRALLVIGMGLLSLAPVAHASVPRSFVGLYDEDASGLRDEARLGVGIVRQPFDWSRVERSPGEFDFSVYDDYVAKAADAGMSVLPILSRPPEFRSSRPADSTSRAMYPPASKTAFANFVTAAVRRYGPDGTFWVAHPRVPFLPIHAWQIWNEPNIPNFWRSGPSAKKYVALLRVGAQAVRAADPGAEVVAAGLPNSNLGVPFLRYLDDMYRAGAKGLFDTLAIHPYSRDVRGLLGLAEDARAVMDRWGDHSRLWITEFGWSTGGDASAFRVSERGQADRIAASLSALIAERRALRLRGFIFFKWRDSVAPPDLGSDPWPMHTGLLDADGVPKRGFWAFGRVVRMLRTQPPDAGSSDPVRIERRNLRLSPLGYAAVGIGCESAETGACAGLLRLRSARAVSCAGRYLPAGSDLGATLFRVAVAPAIAPVRLRGAARQIAECAARIRVRATVANPDTAHAASARSVEFELRAR
jgi:Glycosyl hydrolase catalytic core